MTILKARPPSTRAKASGESAGRWLLGAVAAIYLLLVAPVVVRGGLLADEFLICMRPIRDHGYGPYLASIWHDTGVVRPARFLELFLISKTCTWAPYGLVILVPLALKFLAAFLLYALLRDLRVQSPWPEVGAALWLLEPVGTEAALWPAALHVLLGLVLALGALRLYRSGHVGWAAAATLGAALSVEQVIFALPLAVWLVTPAEKRRTATFTAAAIVGSVLLAYGIWPGDNPRQAVTLAERFGFVLSKGAWYVFFPAFGLGLHSGAMAFRWAFPYGIAIVLAGAVGGAALLPGLLSSRVPPRIAVRTIGRTVLGLVVLVGLINLPLVVTEVGYSGRTFTPTWLVLAGALATGGSIVHWRKVRFVGFLAGVFVAFALLSIALSVSVRLRTDDFNKAAARWIADRTQNGDIVAVCDVGRTVVEPAPLGAFHLGEFHWPSGAWIQYYTGRIVEIRRSGERYWGSRCPDLTGADLVVRFPKLVRIVDDEGDT